VAEGPFFSSVAIQPSDDQRMVASSPQVGCFSGPPDDDVPLCSSGSNEL